MENFRHVSDGWKDTRNRPLIKMIVMSPKGAMFLRGVDCKGEVKDSQFKSRVLIEAIETVGSQNVVHMITDNAKNCRGAGAWLRIDTTIFFEHHAPYTLSSWSCNKLAPKKIG